MKRRNSKTVKVGRVLIGGNNRITVQSMLNVRSDNINGNIRQAKELENAGCDILRVAIPNMSSVNLISKLKEKINIPIVADIHFNFKLAIESVAAGVDKIRINPGNIGDNLNIKAVVQACKQKDIPIRIGVNSGSLEKNILKKYGRPTPEALCESAMYHVSLLEKFDFDNTVISIKSSNVADTVQAYRLLADRCDYPLHIGITEAGTERMGTIKSAIAIGALLLDGIGDTIRVSLTSNPVKEVYAGIDILKSVNLYNKGITFVSCPTCGRTRVDLIKLANDVEEKLSNCNKKIKVAIMGCVVNGPGEAADADIGICGGNGIGIIFKKGKEIKRVKEDELLNELLKQIEQM